MATKMLWWLMLGLVCVAWRTVLGEYIRADELILSDDLEPGTRLIDLNQLLSKDKDKGLIFKMVNDSSLVNYLELRQVTKLQESTRTVVVLAKSLRLDELCVNERQCVHTLKIVAVNENEFIEVPIEIRKQARAEKVRLRFAQPNVALLMTSLTSSFALDAVLVEAKRGRKRLESTAMVEYRAVPEESTNSVLEGDDQLALTVTKHNETKLKLTALFRSYHALLGSAKKTFKFRLEAFIPESFEEFVVVKNASMQIEIKVDLPKESLEPLEFEQPLYSIAITDSHYRDAIVFTPRLKIRPIDQVIFTIFFTSKDPGQVPFEIDSHSGAVRFKTSPRHLIEESSSDQIDFAFSLKATYAKLISNASKLTYYQEYMIPALAKVHVTLTHAQPETVYFELESLLPAESLKSIANQSYAIDINEPLGPGSNLIRVRAKSDLALDWELSGDAQLVLSGLTGSEAGLMTTSGLSDGRTYKALLKLREKSHKPRPWIAELQLELNVDHNPLRFERQEYLVKMRQSDFIDQDLIRIATKTGAKVFYRIESEAESFFEINAESGWLKVIRRLPPGPMQFQVRAESAEEGKKASAWVKVEEGCEQSERPNLIRYKLPENFEGRVGSVEPICIVDPLSFALGNSLFAKICFKSNGTCDAFDLGPNAAKFFSVDAKSGVVISNGLFNSSLFVDEAELNLTVYVQVSMSTLRGEVNISLEMPVVASPKLLNFYESLLVLESGENSTDDVCLFKYEYLAEPSFEYGAGSIQFVQMGLETAEAMDIECAASLVIDSVGCLSIRPNGACAQILNNRSQLFLLSGSYNVEFKVCLLDSGKAACSQVYKQTLVLTKDLAKASRLSSVPLLTASRLDSQAIFRSMANNSYFVALMSVIGAVAIVALGVMGAAVIKSCRNKQRLKSTFALPAKQPIEFK